MRHAWLVFNKKNPTEIAAVCSSLRSAVSVIVTQLVKAGIVPVENVKKTRDFLSENQENAAYKIQKVIFNEYLTKQK